ncbi:N5-glutamine S-adenosyl-L-methionine-dependent methyltransferase [Actinoplanes sp. NBRC 14428]|nr:N5-glutamine S-adenosyl-L-methionine-dependent methyltransferase [Actinoplanes sp. NBRC 14428]
MLNTDLAEAVVRLRAAGCVFAEDEAAVLGEAASDAGALRELVRRRAEGEPLEQVVGYADFCGVRVRLRPGVFVPRVRSELLVTLAAEHAGTSGGGTERKGGVVVVDLCCGSGALGMAVRHLVPGIDLHAADSDPAAVACALDNLGASVHRGDLFTALPRELRGRIDVLIANVPYVVTRHIPFLPAEARLHEPHTALDGGADGLDVFRAVVAEAGAWLAPGGLLLSEITTDQIEPATDSVRAAALRPATHTDDDLEATVVTATRP